MNQLKPTVSLSMKTLIRECSLPNIAKEDIATRYANLIRNHHIHDVFGNYRYGYDFNDRITCYNDGEHMIGFFHPSYDDFLENIVSSLGCSKDIINTISDEELTKVLKSRIDYLKTIPNERELKKEFPMLYHDLVYGRGLLMEAESINKNTSEGKEKYKKETEQWYSCGLRKSYSNFIDAQTRLYARFVGRRDRYKESVENLSYNKFIKDHFDMNKVAMYTIYSYLKKCESLDNLEEIRPYLSMIHQYMNSSLDKNVSLRDEDGSIINMKTIQEELLKIRKRIDKENSLKVNWRLLPKGYRVVSKEGPVHARQLSINEEVLEKYREAGRRKQAFYESSPYMQKIIGLSQYKGYVGYIYPGKVVLDTEYFEDTPRSAKGNAIYVMKARDFIELSSHDKTELQSDERVQRIIHSPKWEQNVQQVLNQPVDVKDLEESKQLIRKLGKK